MNGPILLFTGNCGVELCGIRATRCLVEHLADDRLTREAFLRDERERPAVAHVGRVDAEQQQRRQRTRQLRGHLVGRHADDDGSIVRQLQVAAQPGGGAARRVGVELAELSDRTPEGVDDEHVDAAIARICAPVAPRRSPHGDSV